MSAQSLSPRTVFVLDVSESMSGMKRETLHLSATRYIEDIPDGYYVGIVLFENIASINHRVVKITDRSVRDSLVRAVPIKSCGGTEISAGLLTALKALRNEGISTEGATIILVTDGEDNCCSGAYVDRVLPQLLSAKVRVICLAIGKSADPYLDRLAKETNGNTYVASDNNREMAVRVIESAFQEVKISKELSESITIEVSKDLIAIIEQTLNKTIIIDSDIGRNTNFTIGSEDFDKFSVSLTSPKGQKYDSTSSEYVKNQSLKRYQFKLKSAEPGIWTISFVKHSNVKICATISVMSQPFNSNATQMRVWLKDADINTGMPPIIFAEICKGSDAVIGAEVTATIDKPNGTQTNVKLNNLNDIYCNYFTDYCGSGRYNVSVSAKSAQFQRQRIVGCFKVTDFMPSTPKDPKRLEELSKTESLSSKSISSKFFSQSVEAPAPRNAKAPIARIRTNVSKKTNEESDEIKKAKEELKHLLLLVKRLLVFSKLSDSEKEKYKKDIENIESFIFSAKNGTMTDVDNNRSELEALKQKFSQK